MQRVITAPNLCSPARNYYSSWPWDNSNNMTCCIKSWKHCLDTIQFAQECQNDFVLVLLAKFIIPLWSLPEQRNWYQNPTYYKMQNLNCWDLHIYCEKHREGTVELQAAQTSHSSSDPHVGWSLHALLMTLRVSSACFGVFLCPREVLADVWIIRCKLILLLVSSRQIRPMLKSEFWVIRHRKKFFSLSHPHQSSSTHLYWSHFPVSGPWWFKYWSR